MTKKIDLHITDALISSDEWESFDYNLRLQIKELAEIEYNNKPQLWKDNLAYSYLYHAEKLLLEKNQIGDREIENIRELQTLIKKYDNFKTCLLTLRIAMIALRAGLIPELITEGEARIKYCDEQQKKRGLRRTWGGLTTEEIKERDQRVIDKFKNSKLTMNSFAKKYQNEFELKPSQIRTIIRNAKIK